MENDALLKSLRSTRADYDDEVTHHRFLLDTITGTGGYRGRVGPAPVSILGWAAEAYTSQLTATQTWALLSVEARAKLSSWLDQFAREDFAKFQDRVQVSHFVNYTGPILETLLAYIDKEESNRDKVPAPTASWMKNADGLGTPWDTLWAEVIRPRAAGLGWCPVLLDMPKLEGDKELSMAQAREVDAVPRAIPLYPMNVLDWQLDVSGELIAVKIKTSYTKRTDLLVPAKIIEVYSMWYADRCLRYTVELDEHGKASNIEREEFTHGFGRIPLVIVRAKPATEDKVRGASIISDVADTNRRIFNIDSEWDDFLRNSCFPVLGIPVFSDSTEIGEIIGGNGSAIKIPQEAKQPLHFVAPPESVPGAIEKRREVLVRELYRAARVEFAKPSGVTTSGIARAYEFEQTNRRLGTIAASFARGEQEALRLVSRMLGDNDSELTVTPPADFSVEDLAADLTNLIGAINLGVGVVAETELKRRLVRRMLPNLPSDVSTAIDSELDDLQTQAKQDDALEREANNATLQRTVEGTEPESEDPSGFN